MSDLVNLMFVADEFLGPLKSILMLNGLQVKSKRRIARMEERKLWNPC
jgi:hypothetical protein